MLETSLVTLVPSSVEPVCLVWNFRVPARRRRILVRKGTAAPSVGGIWFALAEMLV